LTSDIQGKKFEKGEDKRETMRNMKGKKREKIR
jgi:hypothetical protein